jgi:hypothetical protein
MSRDGSIVNLPKDYSGYLLVFNEPNNPEPYGCHISAEVAINNYKILVQTFPNAKMVVGGTSSTAINWLTSFVSLIKSEKLPKPYAYASHGYPQGNITVSKVKSEWTKAHNITGSKLWITEYSTVNGKLSDFKSMTDWIRKQPWIERYATFTNRSNPVTDIWEIKNKVDLIDWNTGNFTPMGKYYSSL